MTLHTSTSLSPVLMASASGASEDVTAPEWIHLLPTAAGDIATDDNRGPYRVEDAAAIIAASFADQDRLPIDQDHATDLAAPKGLPAPARGWIVEMQARADGIWGRVEWTREGAAMVADRAYRAISPVILHDKAKRIFAILRASLVNRPNFKGLAALNAADDEQDPNQEDDPVKPLEQIALALGLQASASVEDILAAIGAKSTDPALQASLQAATDAVTALQATVAEQATQIATLTQGTQRRAAEAFVDGAIAAKRAGVNAGTRDHFITLHMANPAQTEDLIGKMPQLGPTGMTQTPPAALKDGEIALNASDIEAARLLGVPVEKFAEARKKEAV